MSSAPWLRSNTHIKSLMVNQRRLPRRKRQLHLGELVIDELIDGVPVFREVMAADLVAAAAASADEPAAGNDDTLFAPGPEQPQLVGVDESFARETVLPAVSACTSLRRLEWDASGCGAAAGELQQQLEARRRQH